MTAKRGEDPNEVAARIVRESTASEQPLPAGLEAAWAAWSRGVGKVDGRTMALLRAAFEAGVGAAAKTVELELPAPSKNAAAVAMGRLGGAKGGLMRAAKLSPQARATIAQNAAKARWAKKRS